VWQHQVPGLALCTAGELREWQHTKTGISAPGFPNFFAAVRLSNSFTNYVFTSASPQITAHLS